jgi:hypothetical protein
MLFASPGFGASIILDVLLLIFWPAVAVAAAFGIRKGANLYVHGTGGTRRAVAVIVASLALPVGCYFAPRCFMRIVDGNFPVGEELEARITNGMSMAEARAILGPPHVRRMYNDGVEVDTYWMDALCRRFFDVDYDQNHRVVVDP